MKRKPRILALWGLLSIIGLGGATLYGQESDAARVEEEAKKLERLVVSPCCWTQPVADHFSGASFEVRKEIRDYLGSGLTSEQVLEKLEAKYGPQILAAPPTAGFSLLAYVLPAVFLAVAGWIALIVYRRLRPKTPTFAKPPKPKKIAPRFAKLLEETRRDL